MTPVRLPTLTFLSVLLATTHVLGQAVGNNPAPAATTAADTIAAPSSEPATTGRQTSAGQTSAGSSVATSAGTSTGQTSNEPTRVGTSTGTSASSASQTTPTSPSAIFATTNNPSTSTQPPLPTLANVLPPPLIVPDTSKAPFMQKSNLPEGTVFICVGAALGFLGLCVLAWRGLVAWSLHRSVKRAAETAYAPDTKSMFGWGGATTTSGGYKSMYTDSNLSMEALSNTKTAYGGAGEVHGGKSKEDYRHDKRASHQPKRSSKMPPSSDLFFSPTNAGAGANAATSRASGYMPAGYYAPGASQANSGNPIAHFGRGSEGVGYGRLASRDGLATPSPPDSPSLRPQSKVQPRPQSSHLRPASAAGPAGNPKQSARLSIAALAEHDAAQGKGKSKLGTSGDFPLNAPPQGRAPSMYLEDLFENHGHAG